MRISWLKVFVFLFSLCLLGSAIYAARRLYQKMFAIETMAVQVRNGTTNALPPPDPGLAIYDSALELLKGGETVAGRDKLVEITRHYQDSKRFADAKKIIGELNVSALLSDEPGPGKDEHIVKRGDSVLAIVNKANTTLEYVVRVNGMFGLMIQPGDRITTAELKFEAVADKSSQTLTLLRNARFFKEYPLTAVRLPFGTRIPFETTLKARSAIDAKGNSVAPLKKDYADVEKWLIFARPGVILRAQTRPLKDTDTGIYLTEEDMDELMLLLPTGTQLKFVE